MGNDSIINDYTEYCTPTKKKINPMKDFRNKDSQFVLLNSVKKKRKSGFFSPTPKSKYNTVNQMKRYKRWRAVKHSLWVPCKVTLYYTLESNAAYMVGMKY